MDSFAEKVVQSEKETLTCRLIDRPIRPLFPKGFMNEVQVVCTVLSTDKDQDPDIAAMIGTSAALAISGIPFKGPLGAARVGYMDGNYILNPGYAALKDSMLNNMMVAGTESAVLMVESEANEMTEDEMLGGVFFSVIKKCRQSSTPLRSLLKSLARKPGTGRHLKKMSRCKMLFLQRSRPNWGSVSHLRQDGAASCRVGAAQ